MTDGTTCPPPEAGRRSTLTGLFVTIFLSALAAYATNGLVAGLLDLHGLLADAVRLAITLAAILAGISLLRLYRRRPLAPIKGGP
jgi:hypothetical protein